MLIFGVFLVRILWIRKASNTDTFHAVKISIKMRYNTAQTKRSYFDFVVSLFRLNLTFLLIYFSSKNEARGDIINT